MLGCDALADLFRYVESALHGGVQEVVNAMSQDEVLAVSVCRACHATVMA